MYLKIRKSAHPFITEWLKNELLFSSISGWCDDIRLSQKASNLIKSNYSLIRLVLRLLEKVKISAHVERILLSKADLLTRLPYCRWSSRLIDRALVLRDRGGES